MKYDTDDLMLLNMAGVGYIRLKALLDHFGSTGDMLKARPRDLQRIKEIGPVLAQKISAIKDRKGLKEEWNLVKKHGVTLLSIFDKDYPERLKNIYDPPVILYIKGKLTEEDRTAIALVGSRKASNYGLNVCRSLSRSLAGLGLTIVSGLARGIDSAAHRGALEASGRTLAVLGNGLCAVYPPENRDLAGEIVHSGALVSEFPMETPPLPQNFPIRNRIISGLSLGVVIVEAAEKSGALITAECAAEQGREVFAVPGKASAATSAGTHGLIKNGAKLVDNVNDIIEELNLELVPNSTSSGPAGPRGLDGDEKKIYNILSDEPEHIDDIVERTDLAPQQVTRLLLELEVKKLVKQLPGKNFVTTN